ncbi:MAG: C25 family cysteine peptidase [Candidatus Thermoplasmatota archaeon]|nr:C25 family cysteine peptidase [Candidatus Thermoplasmatota archaeon]
MLANRRFRAMYGNKTKSKVRRKSIAIFVFAMMLFTSFSVFATTDSENGNHQISVKYSFETPIASKVRIGNTIYDNVALQDAAYYGNPGEPSLPVKGAYILLPQNTKAASIKIAPSEKMCLGSGYHIMPVGNPVPLSQSGFPSLPVAGPIYNSEKEFPGELYTNVGTYSFRGYNILVLMLHPIQYIPATGELFYYGDMTVYVDTVNGENINPLFRGLERDKQEVNKKVDNPAIASTYTEQTTKANSNTYDLLILTTNLLKSYFDPLKNYHDSHGISTVIKTLDDIGGSTPEDIRGHIRDAYTNWGIDYVLIGGDDVVVPAKTLWIYGLDENTTPYETFMPSDLYYACLDGTYNHDGDNKWGEPTDGEDGGDVDLMAEVYVGRACAGDKNEVNNFVDKTISYMSKDADPYLKKILLAGEYLGDYGVASWGGNYLDQIVDGSNLDGYTTVGIPSDEFNIEKMYDRDWRNNHWTKEDMIGRINDGVHVVQHDGHSYYTYNMKMVNNDTEELENDKYCFIYSNGCMAGGFDRDDCIAEYFTVKTGRGAFAGIWNARYGWFWSFSTDGDSQRFAREFWDGVFGEHMPVIGKANQDSKEDNLYLIGRSCMRWTYYELNLFGDPSIAFRINNPPNKPAAPSGPSWGKKGEECTYTSVSTDIEGDQIYYQWDWGDGSYSDWLGPFDSGQDVNASRSWAERGVYNVRVKAKDINGGESDWSDPLRVRMPKAYLHGIWQLIEKINEWFMSLFHFELMPLK